MLLGGHFYIAANTGRLLVVTENDRKLILELVHAQLLEGILMRSFEDGLDHCEPHVF